MTVNDTQSPTISCPANIVTNAVPGMCAAVVNFAVGATDNCSGVTVTNTPPSGSVFPKGTTTVTSIATDAYSNVATCTFTVTVRDMQAPTIACPANLSRLVDSGQCAAVVNFAPAVSDNCPGATYACSPPPGTAFPIGTTTVACLATDASGNTASCAFNVTVANSSPVVTITGPPSGAIFALNTAVTFTGSFTDNDGDMRTAGWSFSSNLQTVNQVGVVNDSTGAVSASYTFTTVGVYLVTLAVTDQCGSAGAADMVDELTAMVVIYDPNGEFVTGGGWINSPPGACTSNPSLTGRASFGFVSKYQQGAPVPTGNTEFQLRVTNFNFKSTSYDWLVIGGARAQYKGTGTINGSGSYDFMLTAIDGEVNGGDGLDKFRIKIRDKATGQVVYDNQRGASDTSNPTTAIEGGSIVIHSN